MGDLVTRHDVIGLVQIDLVDLLARDKGLDVDRVRAFERDLVELLLFQQLLQYSGIIKQFKLSCIKTNYQFQSMVVRNSKFTSFIDEFTSSTYIMVIVSGADIE